MSETAILRVPHVVIVGGGFGGLWAARALRRVGVSVTLIDRRNHHVFQPLLYQVATAALSPADVSGPIRSILRKQSATEVRMAEVTGFDLLSREVRLAVLNANVASERAVLAQKLVNQTARALELARSRYDLGLSSIVEVSQAQLANTQAEIQLVNARYDIQLQRAVLAFHVGRLQ